MGGITSYCMTLQNEEELITDPLFNIKMVVVGDTASGKTSFITSFLSGGNDIEVINEPTVLEVFQGVKNINDR